MTYYVTLSTLLRSVQRVPLIRRVVVVLQRKSEGFMQIMFSIKLKAMRAGFN